MVVFVGVAHIQSVVVRHLVAERRAPDDLFSKQSFEDLFIWDVVHLRQNRLPILEEAAQVIVVLLDLEQVLEFQQRAIRGAYLVMLVHHEQDLSPRNQCAFLRLLLFEQVYLVAQLPRRYA